MSKSTTGAVQISVAILMVAVLLWTGIGLLFNANEYTTTTETFTGVNLTFVNLGNTQPLIANGESVYNATSGIIPANGGTNYTMNNTDGSIAINTTSGYMVAGDYSITYHQGAVSSTVANIGKLLVGLVLFIVVVVILLNYAGIKVNK